MTYTIESLSDSVAAVTVAGCVDEDNRFAALAHDLESALSPLGRATAPTIIVDVEHLERMNSCGVRDWVDWLRVLDERDVEVHVIRCQPALVSQLNLITNFLGHAALHSFYLPYHCTNCEHDEVVLVETASASGQAPRRRCQRCEHVSTFDEHEATYFSFLSDLRTPKVDEPLRELITTLTARKSEQAERRERDVKSDVDSDATLPSGTWSGLLSATDSGVVQPSTGSSTAGHPALLPYIVLAMAAITLVLLVLATR